MNEIRKDNKGRALNNYEYQREDGIYYYVYYDSNGKPHREYSWKLVPTDKTPKNKVETLSLREKEEYIVNDRIDELHAMTKQQREKRNHKQKKKVNTSGLYKKDVVCTLLGISDRTLINWYLFKSKYPDSEYAQLIPKPTQFEKRGTRYWTESDIVTLQQFKQIVPKGRLGLKNS